MHGKRVWFAKAERTVGTGLCLGAVILAAGCVSPLAGPGLTATPKPSPALTSAPVTATPVPTETEPGSSVTATPQATPGEHPTVPVIPTEAPEPTPTSAPEVTGTGQPESTGVPGPMPEVTGLPEVSVTPIPMPTGLPEYDTLVRNGWQRTEDFFGEREIFFSGKFDLTELSVSAERYEYRYRASSDADILFLIIGEHLSVQQFLEDLTQEKEECLIVRESDGDYGYTYREEERQVTGRVYACGSDGNEQRMRVEFYGPVTGELSTEGYGFYLR